MRADRKEHEEFVLTSGLNIQKIPFEINKIYEVNKLNRSKSKRQFISVHQIFE